MDSFEFLFSCTLFNTASSAAPQIPLFRMIISELFLKSFILVLKNNAYVLKSLQLQQPLKSSKTNLDLYLGLDMSLHVNNTLIYPVVWFL